MKVKAKLLAALAATALGCSATVPAMADDGGWKRHHRGHHNHHHWKHDRHDRHHGHGHYFHHGHGAHERVIVGRPVYVERPIYVHRPIYVDPYPYPYYAPIRRHPGVVVTVDLPPLVFPLR